MPDGGKVGGGKISAALACMPSSPIMLIESFSLRSMPVRVASIYQYSFAAGFTPSHPAAVLVRFRTLVGPPPCPCNLSWKLKACRLTSLRGQSVQVGLYQPSNTWWIPRLSLNRSYQKSSARLNSLGCKNPRFGRPGQDSGHPVHHRQHQHPRLPHLIRAPGWKVSLPSSHRLSSWR